MAAAADLTSDFLLRKISVMKWRITGENKPDFLFISERYPIRSVERTDAASTIVNGVENLLNYVKSQTGFDHVFLDHIDRFLNKLSLLFAKHDTDPNSIGTEISQYANMLVEQLRSIKNSIQHKHINDKEDKLKIQHKQFLEQWYDMAIAAAKNDAEKARLQAEKIKALQALQGGRRKRRTRRRK